MKIILDLGELRAAHEDAMHDAYTDAVEGRDTQSGMATWAAFRSALEGDPVPEDAVVVSAADLQHLLDLYYDYDDDVLPDQAALSRLDEAFT